MDEQATEESFATLWHDLDTERQTRKWTRERLARRTSQLSRQPYPEKTLHDRMTHGRRVSWEQIMWIVRALELDEQLWKHRWEKANNSRRRLSPQTMAESDTTPDDFAHTVNDDLTPTNTPPVEPMGTSPTFWKSRFASVIYGFIVGAAATLISSWGMNWFANDLPQSATCTLVNPITADAFMAPGDPKPAFIKNRGDQIRLVDISPTVTANGDRYRIVYTSRTPSGYAYMREETLSSIVPCK